MATNRCELNTALAKAIAYKECGKFALAAQWAETLVQLLYSNGILTKV